MSTSLSFSLFWESTIFAIFPGASLPPLKKRRLDPPVLLPLSTPSLSSPSILLRSPSIPFPPRSPVLLLPSLLLPSLPSPSLHVTSQAGAHPGFPQGGEIFPCIVASRVGKSTLRKLFTMLQASSVLPHSKKLKNRLQSCKTRNLTEETLKNQCFSGAQGWVPHPHPRVEN